MRLVHVERPADLRRGSPALGRLSQFVENARLRQRQVSRWQVAVQEANLAGVKAVERTNLVGQCHGDGSCPLVLSQTTLADDRVRCKPANYMARTRKGQI